MTAPQQEALASLQGAADACRAAGLDVLAACLQGNGSPLGWAAVHLRERGEARLADLQDLLDLVHDAARGRDGFSAA